MSVVGVGIDIVAVARIGDLLKIHGDRFLNRCFRPGELSPGDPDPASVAGCWAAKEAFLKALGTDVRHIPYRDIQVIGDGTGPRNILLHGQARAAFEGAGGSRVHLSIGRERSSAVASVIIVG